MKQIGIKRLNNSCMSQFKELVQLFHLVFETADGKIAEDAHLEKLLNNPAFICIVAIIDDKIAGGVTAYEMLSYYGNYSEAYLYDIAISNEHQRNGIGNMLLESLKSHCSEHNIKTFFVEASAEDVSAVKFYQATGGNAEKVIHFNYHV